MPPCRKASLSGGATRALTGWKDRAATRQLGSDARRIGKRPGFVGPEPVFDFGRSTGGPVGAPPGQNRSGCSSRKGSSTSTPPYQRSCSKSSE